MNKTFLCLAVLTLAACGGEKTDAAKSGAPASSGSATSAGAKSGTAATTAEKPAAPAAPEMVELSLAPVDKSLADYVMMAPKDAKIDGTQVKFGESDFLDLSPAPGWADAIKGLSNDNLNSNIKKVSDTEYRWERTPPIGKMYMVDVLFKVGSVNWSCTTGLTGPLEIAAADTISKMCNSITKKKK